MGETPLEAQGGDSGTGCGTGEGLGCPRISEGMLNNVDPPQGPVRVTASVSKDEEKGHEKQWKERT